MLISYNENSPHTAFIAVKVCQVFTCKTKMFICSSITTTTRNFDRLIEKNRDVIADKVSCPDALIGYNRNINIFDKFYQNLNAYKMDRMSNKWRHFFLLILLYYILLILYVKFSSNEQNTRDQL